MTLALLLTAVTGAWAEEKMVTINSSTMSSGAVTATGFGILLDNLYVNVNTATITTSEGVITKLVIKKGDVYVDAFNEDNVGVTPGTITYGSDEITVTDINAESVTLSRKGGDNWSTSSVDVYYGAAEPPLTVAWDASTKTGTFSMPGSDVVLTPIYAKAAAFATTGSEPEVKTLQPAAAEGVIAGTDASLIAEGTGIVAFAGTSTDVTQGTLMYAIGTSATEAPALTAFSATVPTAAGYDDAATVNVWYYIQGADAPEGVAATLDNTFDNTEPACLTVQVLTNKFDIQFNAANANTIEAGMATVTVGGTAATVTEGKLEGVKMGSEVKLKAKDGYKFRKVEVKKGAGDAGKSLAEATVGMIIGSDGKAYAADDKDNLPEGVTVAAKVCYVDGNGHGLALALTDEVDKMNWSTAQTTCDAHTPAITGGTWKLASQGEWNNMISAAGSHTALRDGFSSVGGTNMQSEGYWSSTEDDSSDAWNYYFSNGLWSDVSKNWNRCVRACLAF